MSNSLRGGLCTSTSCNSSRVFGGIQAQGLSVGPRRDDLTATGSPLPTVTGIDTPMTSSTPIDHCLLQWWEILPVALECASIFMLVLMDCRLALERHSQLRCGPRASAVTAWLVSENGCLATGVRGGGYSLRTPMGHGGLPTTSS